jgi:hypothetical protein
MKKQLRLLAALVGLGSGFAWAQGETSQPTRPLQEDQRRSSQSEGRTEPPIEGGPSSLDLWYGTPGVRAGGDLIRPLIDLFRRPSGLLDFTPRKVPRTLPDRETTIFPRER